jgi:hypothetical protein
MEQKNKYARGKIYIIRSHLTDKIYVGSTVNKLSKRLNDHKTFYKRYKEGKSNRVTVYEIFDIDFEGAFIELHHYYSCETRAELNREEGKLIREIDCINKQVAGRTKAEYHQDNKQRLNKYGKQWRRHNKQRCSEYGKQWRRDNKQKYNEYYIQRYQNNKERILELCRQKFECNCGGHYTRSHQSRHFKSIKHTTWIFNQWNQFNHL